MKFLNLSLFCLMGAFFCSSVVFSGPISFKAERPTQVWSVVPPDVRNPRFDVSGLIRYQDQFLVVSDRYEYQKIYKLEMVDSKTFQAREYLSPRRSVKNKSERPYLDIEGIGFCAGHFYVVDEEHQMVMEIDAEGRTKEHLIDLLSIHRQKKAAFASGTDSAGLEGVTCDEATSTLYVANERLFRMIYKINLKTWKVEDFFDVPAGWDLPRKQGDLAIFQDFSDLHFANGYLYALQRVDRTILKIDPKTQNLVATLKLQFAEKDFYETKEPFGMAEGLFLDQNKIYIVLDNNGMKLKASPQIHGLLMEFKRPKGF